MNGRLLLYFIPIVSNILFNFQEWALSPLLIYIVEGDRSGNVHEGNIDYWMIVIFVSASAVSFFALTIQGFIASRFGYKTAFCMVYCFSLLGNIIQFIKYDDILYFVVGQVIYGLSSSSLISQTWLNFVVDDSEAVKMQVLFENSYSIGCILGVLGAGLANEYITGMNTWRVINLFIICCDLLLLISILFVYEPFQHREGKIKLSWTKSFRLKETQSTKQPSDQENSFRDGSSTFTIRNICTGIVCSLVIGVCSAVYNSYLSIELESEYNFSVLQVCIVYASLALMSLVWSNVMIERITNILKERTLLISFIILTVLYVTLGSLQTKAYIIIIVFFMAIEFMHQFTEVSNGVAIQNRTPEKLRVKMLVVSINAHEFGYVIGGFLVVLLPTSYLFYLLGGLSFIMSAAVKCSKYIDNVN